MMTDDELNQAIAVKRWWESRYDASQKCDYWWNTKKCQLQRFTPPYCNSWEWAGPLLQEMAHPDLRRWNDKWFCCPDMHVGMNENFVHIYADSPTRAIAEAWNEANQ